ncbi:MAG: hypothetical protein H5U02_06630 [Clostridia bacterium]|nr:hypothetical protein [Clostridia bacterium]
MVSRIFKVILAVSLTINMVVAGFLVKDWLHARQEYLNTQADYQRSVGFLRMADGELKALSEEQSKPKQLRHLAAADNHLMRSIQFFQKVEPALARAGAETQNFMPRLSDVESIIYGQLLDAILGTTSPGIDPSAPAKAQAQINSWVKVFPQEKLPDRDQAQPINASLRE